MKNWLAIVCVLGSLCGGVFTMYSAVSVGSDGLKSMATSLKSISKVVNNYYKNLNNARNKVMPAISSLQLYVNTTYTALNSSYGATQTGMQSIMSNVEWFSQQFTYADQMVSSMIGNDLNQLSYQLQETINQIMQSYSMLANSFSYQENGDDCSVQFAGVSSSIPVQLAKFGQCLQTEVDTVPTMVAPLKAILKMAKNDLISLNKQLKICAPTSTNCIDAYFMDIYGELNSINMELYLAQSLLSNYQQDAMQRNQMCGQLITSNVQDAIQNLQMQFSQCMYPQTSMG
ncbi:uncharacterized protein LOC135705048 [Ochlerotatus camptorhynchus]|uniref:uncharacterized protein LOC135705048 n=1 Tax=Ochlerotatus camptorhynchus TaxID=644619 RepID=UPI0031E27BB9